MKKLSTGLDVRKATNVIGLAFADMSKPVLHKKVSADLLKRVAEIRHIQKFRISEAGNSVILYLLDLRSSVRSAVVEFEPRVVD